MDAARSATLPLSDVLKALYRVLLFREPDPIGFAAGIKGIRDGLPIEDAMRGMLRSKEFGGKRERFLRTYLSIDSSAKIDSDPDASRLGNLIIFSDVEVCMIVYNEAEFLQYSLKPLARLFNRFIIVDMGSQDATLQIIGDILGRRAHIVQYGREQLLEFGYAHARNYGASFATSPWILAVDADEILASGFSSDGIIVGRNLEGMSIATVKRINLQRKGSESIEGLNLAEAPQRSTERHRRLYRSDANVRWAGYIHETLHAEPRDLTAQTEGASEMTFYHLSEFRDQTYDRRKRERYFWMMLRAYDNPELRDGTNSYWYDKHVPDNIEMIRAGARSFAERFNPKKDSTDA